MQDVALRTAGTIVHSYFGRANAELEEIDGQLWIEVDYTVERDMHDCFLAGKPINIDGIDYMIEQVETRASGYVGAFRLRKV